jgi:hypothetical protein
MQRKPVLAAGMARIRDLCVLMLLGTAAGWPQMLMTGSGGMVRLFGTDQAVFEMQEPRKDLPCTVTPSKTAQVGFDLKFHGGYEVSVPLKELAGSENLLTILFRVSPVESPGNYTYFVQRVRVPQIEDEAKGEASLYGAFDLGEGKYKVDWLMRDRAERVCSDYWEVEAQLKDRDNQIEMAMQSGEVRPADTEFFRSEPPVERANDKLAVKILLNYAPQNPRSSTMRPVDTSALVSILRNIARDPRVTKFSLVAFSMQEEKIVYRQQNADKIDFPALGEALDKIELGKVDLARLADKKSDIRFLTNLMQSELGRSDDADAVIFAGPKVMLDNNIESEQLRELGTLEFPVFYMNYNLYPHAVPWRDTIGNAVKYLKGVEYTISRPRDLWFATTEVVNRIVKSRSSRISQNAGTQ